MAIVFDGQWTLSLSPDATEIDDADGPLISNGKLGLVPCTGAGGAGLDTTRSSVALGGKLYGESLEAFHFCALRMAAPDPAETEHTLLAMSLNMATGTYVASHLVSRRADGAVLAAVTHEVRALQHLPNFALHTVALTLPPAQQASGFPVFHEVRAASQTLLLDPEFGSAVLHAPGSVYGGSAETVYMLTGRVSAPRAERTAHYACCYLFEEPELAENLGFNVHRRTAGGAGSAAYNKLLFRGPAGSSGIRTTVFHVLSGVMTDADEVAPADVLRRVILGQASRCLSQADAAAQLVARHNAAWAALWLTDVTVDAKSGLTDPEAGQLHRVLRALRYALYNLLACMRAGSVLDLEGGVSSGTADAWLLPAAVLLRNDVALSALDARYACMEQAARSAASYGYRGLKFAFQGDDDAYWDADAPLRVFNTAMVAINAWNYYRVSQDRDWLRERGYALLKGIADMIVSAATPDAANVAAYHIVGALGFQDGDGPATDNSLTVASAVLALRSAIEASYEMGVYPKPAWLAVRYGLAVPMSELYVVRRDATPADGNGLACEPLLTLGPMLREAAFSTDTGRPLNVVLTRNVARWAPDSDADGTAVPLIIAAQAYAQLAQYTPARVSDFAAKTIQFLDATEGGGQWRNLRGDSRGPHNDVSRSAMLILAIVQGVGGATVHGGVTETQFYYASLGVTVPPTSALPLTWERLHLKGLGPNRHDYTVVNSILFPTPPLLQSQVTPWSVDSLTY
jgi:hypothetical protein